MFGSTGVRAGVEDVGARGRGAVVHQPPVDQTQHPLEPGGDRRVVRGDHQRHPLPLAAGQRAHLPVEQAQARGLDPGLVVARVHPGVGLRRQQVEQGWVGQIQERLPHLLRGVLAGRGAGHPGIALDLPLGLHVGQPAEVGDVEPARGQGGDDAGVARATNSSTSTPSTSSAPNGA